MKKTHAYITDIKKQQKKPRKTHKQTYSNSIKHRIKTDVKIKMIASFALHNLPN